MIDPIALTIITIVVALIFDFINGFHDASNSIATIVATRVLRYRQAVLYAAFFNFVAFFTFATGVAKMIGAGMLNLEVITLPAILIGLIGGIIWNLFTWWKGIPASSSHTLMGALAGSVYINAGIRSGNWDPASVFVYSGWIKVLAFIFIAPMIGFGLALLVHKGALYMRKHFKPEHGWSRFFRISQLVSSALLSLNHGLNDAQKTAGVIATAMVAGGMMTVEDFHVPLWVLFLANLFIALGTWMGGWRITKTLGFRLTKLRPMDGFAAETGAALSIGIATFFHLPVSTTLSTTGAVTGVGVSQKIGFNKDVFKRICLTWGLTLPVSFSLAAVLMFLWDVIEGF